MNAVLIPLNNNANSLIGLCFSMRNQINFSLPAHLVPDLLVAWLEHDLININRRRDRNGCRVGTCGGGCIRVGLCRHVLSFPFVSGDAVAANCLSGGDAVIVFMRLRQRRRRVVRRQRQKERGDSRNKEDLSGFFQPTLAGGEGGGALSWIERFVKSVFMFFLRFMFSKAQSGFPD